MLSGFCRHTKSGGVAGARAPRGLGLSRELWVVQAGIFLNMLGYGAAFPFEVVYLHEARGFGLGVAGAIAGLVTGFAIPVTPLAGLVVDRVGARTTAAASGIALAGGYAGLALATTPAAAVAAALLAGVGNGGLNPSQSALIAALAPAERLQRANAVSRVAGNVGIGLGAAVGGFVAAGGPYVFVALLLANAVTYLAFVAILVAAVHDRVRPERSGGGYRQVLRDRALRRFAAVNVAMIAVGWGLLSWIVPSYARAIGIGPRAIGLLLLANTITVIVAQVPIVKAAEGRRRVGALSLGAGAWVVACLLALAAQVGGAVVAFLALAAAAVSFAVGECLHAAAFLPLVADLAPPALRGRYMAAMGLSWWLGLAIAPTVGGQLLAVSPSLPLIGGAGVAAATIAVLRSSESRIPAAARMVPEPVLDR